tara:strand:- start:383 stop:2092 length:1710 start_codon:yes stop_codon:yes gene_type:complete
MMLKENLQGLDSFAANVKEALGNAIEQEPASLSLEIPREESHGEFAVACFQMAQAEGTDPPTVAKRLAKEIEIPGVTAEAVGPFLNFKVDSEILAQTVLEGALTSEYGKGEEHAATVLEFSSPNIAKPMHVGHLRSTVIGAALARILMRLGHRVTRINHLGDWGSQFGKLVAAWNNWGNEKSFLESPINHLLELYVRFHEEETDNPDLKDQAKEAFSELETEEDGETRQLWQRFTEASLQEFEQIYNRLGVSFEHIRGESWYENQLESLVEWLDSCGVLEESEGAQIIDLTEQGIDTPCLVKTAHGTTLYATRDLAAARSRWKEFSFDHSLYVVGSEQNLHFRQFKAALSRCGEAWAEKIEHIPFGLIRMAGGKLSTREGKVLLLSEVLDRACELATETIAEKNPDLPDRESVAEKIGLGAVIFHDLKHQRQKDVVFDWKEVLSFEGDTGPYLQYTHARCCSILRKANSPSISSAEVDSSLLSDSKELMVALGRYPGALREAGRKREPSALAQSLLRIASAGNAFYRDKRVLGCGDENLEYARLAAVTALRNVLADGLHLLGVPAPEEM